MTAGRKPVPTAIKELRGTARPDRVLKNEAEFPIPERMLRVPDGLNQYGEELWRELGKLLLDAGLFSYGDKIALELLCQAYGRMKYANEKMRENGGEVLEGSTGGLYQNPWLSIVNKGWDQVRTMLSEFGLTPAERTRVAALVEDKSEDSLAVELFKAVDAFHENRERDD
jgi:P27 family predicted phage terminase small subunit